MKKIKSLKKSKVQINQTNLAKLSHRKTKQLRGRVCLRRKKLITDGIDDYYVLCLCY